MVRKRSSRDSINTHTAVALVAEAALSFLKKTKGVVSWTISDVVKSLKISRAEAENVVALLEAQGYVQGSGSEWVTSPAGESVSSAKPPRHTRESVEQAVEALKQRIKDTSKDFKAAFKITHAVAFGDFLIDDRTRVQAADVGIGLAPKDQTVNSNTVPAAKLERDFLKQLRGRTALLNVVAYADWMSRRSHIDSL
jgi:hypothetical protein